jgi:hypothetical protein
MPASVINYSHQETFWYVLPKSESLEGPALFSKLQDCSKHSFSCPFESQYHIFRVLKDAIEYLQVAVREQEKAIENKDSQEQQATPSPRDHPEQTAASSRSALREQEKPSAPSPTCPLPSSETKNNHSPSKKRRRANDAATNAAPNWTQRIPAEILPHPAMNRPSMAMPPLHAPHLGDPLSIQIGGYCDYLGASTIPPPSSSRPGALVDDSQRTAPPATTTTEAAYTGMPVVHPQTPKQLKADKRQEYQPFEKYILLLKGFKQEFGDTDVPYRQGVYRIGDKTIDWTKYSGLGKWCSEMRLQLNIYKASKDASQLSSIQASQLRQLGFCMDPIRNLSTKPVWDENHYQQLQAFHQEHGYPYVLFTPSTRLARWVSRLQKAYQRKQEGQQTTLTDQHIARLQKLEFQWNPLKKSAFEVNATKWLAYKAEHGQEPTSEYALGKRVYLTRKNTWTFKRDDPHL